MHVDNSVSLMFAVVLASQVNDHDDLVSRPSRMGEPRTTQRPLLPDAPSLNPGRAPSCQHTDTNSTIDIDLDVCGM